MAAYDMVMVVLGDVLCVQMFLCLHFVFTSMDADMATAGDDYEYFECLTIAIPILMAKINFNFLKRRIQISLPQMCIRVTLAYTHTHMAFAEQCKQGVYEMSNLTEPSSDYPVKIFVIAVRYNDLKLMSRIQTHLTYLQQKRLLSVREYAFLLLDAIVAACIHGHTKILFCLLKHMFEQHDDDGPWALLYANRWVWGRRVTDMVRKACRCERACCCECKELVETALSEPLVEGTWV
jgi:hypothetical protein